MFSSALIVEHGWAEPMSTAAALVTGSSEYEISLDPHRVQLPAKEATEVVLNGVRLEAERISGTVVGSRIKQHNHIYTTHRNNYMANGDNPVVSTVKNEQWETSEVRLRLYGVAEKVFELPFAVSVGEGDFLSIITIYNPKSDLSYTVAAQNHNIGQWFGLERDGLQKMCAKLGVFKLGAVLNNKPMLCILAAVVFLLYAAFGSLPGAAIGGFFLTGFLIVVFQYLVLLPYVLALWPNLNRQLRDLFADFSPWA